MIGKRVRKFKVSKELMNKYTQIPITFVVKSKFEFSGKSRSERQVDPFIKNYDSLESPLSWLDKWDMKNWRAFTIVERSLIAGALVVWNSPAINMLEGRGDLVVLWDLRVSPDYRSQGLGRQLIEEIEVWGKRKNCTELKVETQNINVPACKFYERMGFKVRKVNDNAYERLDEIQLLYFKQL